MEQAQELVAGIEGVQQPDVVALIFRQLSEPQDVLAAAAVCRFTPTASLFYFIYFFGMSLTIL